MKMKRLIILMVVFVFGSVLILRAATRVSQAQESTSSAQSDNKSDELRELEKTIEELKGKLNEVQQQQRSLANTISILNNRILLNEKEIEKTQREIDLLELQISDLSQRIEGLELSLGELSHILIERIQRQYKQNRQDPVSSLLVSSGLSGFIREQRYIKQARAHTETIMISTETKRQVYDEQKQEKETKQRQIEALRDRLEGQRNDLAQQRADKQTLLNVTKNDERVYQDRLAQALAEFQAIQSIIAGGGDESKVSDVKKGDKIASIIAGPSTCSTGAHLHFEVVKGGAHNNPASYLRSVDINWIETPFGFSGDWDWPLNNPARVTQGYGMTSFARTGFYGGSPHTGIDMLSKTAGDWTVKAVQDGELYRGSIRCGKGYLRYVRVKHSDDISTYYLHVNY
jgi:peptidoglycan hydrolase CwlO-like protein